MEKMHLVCQFDMHLHAMASVAIPLPSTSKDFALYSLMHFSYDIPYLAGKGRPALRERQRTRTSWCWYGSWPLPRSNSSEGCSSSEFLCSAWTLSEARILLTCLSSRQEEGFNEKAVISSENFAVV